MRCAIALYQVVRPESIGSYDRLLLVEPLLGDESLDVWQGCLHDWALAKLRRGDHSFGMYLAAVVPVDDHGQPDEEMLYDLIEQDLAPIETNVCWSGVGELVEAS
ncbi:hypothetical protein [Saccharopolyspora sp. ASAGF58]|uniref:hypothetical protein n=1 Tax=Saccharopolyspora sp. ASAGF58 TaxID=2719023 RepID=UPI0014400F93|nr:hypothetical protein [Saccharopolyspora sp. ASAGF58]QIZ33908.1 hypothetical protein FDZ84_03095 [Saccharopolyspora sp. ASAGF58]